MASGAWILTAIRDTAAKVPTMGTILKDISSAGSNVAGQFVVYDLPDRDCAALASNGEYSIANDGVTKYKAYIDSIHDILVTYSTVPVILVIGKYSL
jgi:cellulose 1,4-beta-cellobiosidase